MKNTFLLEGYVTKIISKGDRAVKFEVTIQGERENKLSVITFDTTLFGMVESYLNDGKEHIFTGNLFANSYKGVNGWVHTTTVNVLDVR